MNALLIIIGSILILGLINILIEIHRNRKKKELVITYSSTIIKLIEKINQNKDYSREAVFILSASDDVAKIEDATIYSKVYSLKSEIVNRNPHNIAQECSALASEIVVWSSKLKKELKRILWQFANPFIWFYKGIELILFVTFGYLIRSFNPSYDFDGKGWTLFNTAFSFVAGLASIVALIIELRKYVL